MEHPIAQDIIDLLHQHNYWYDSFTHQPVRTSEEAAAIRSDYTLEQGAKALIVRVKLPEKGTQFMMLVVPGNQRFNSQKVKAVLQSKDVRFATEEEVMDITHGVRPGGVPPFGNLFGLPVICDTTLLSLKTIVFNAGRTVSIAMRSADYRQLVNPTVADIIAESAI